MSTISSDQRDSRPTNSRRDLGISLDQVLGTVVPAALYYHECAGTREIVCLSVSTNLGNPLLSFPQDQDCWSRNDATPSLSSSLIADLLYAIVSEGTTSLPHAISNDGQQPQLMPIPVDVHRGISYFRILKSPFYQRGTHKI